jgi:hypothetical protein
MTMKPCLQRARSESVVVAVAAAVLVIAALVHPTVRIVAHDARRGGAAEGKK